MLPLLYVLLATARSSLNSRRELALENLALRQQLAIVQRKTKRPKLSNADRAFWVALCRLWPGWHNTLLIVKPETVIGWHRKGFKLYWTWKSRIRRGRPPIDSQIRTLIRRMARENPTWGAPRIHGELLKLGFELGEATVSRYMPRRRKPPSQRWRAFLRNHTRDLVSIDFFVVPTATFRVLYVFLVLEHERRRIVHFNVTDGPSAQWAGQQLVNAFPYHSAPKYVIRDRDKIYGADFVRRMRAMGIEQLLTAPQSPWQNPYCERGDRDPSAGLPQPRHRSLRAAPTAHPAQLPRVLSRLPDPPRARQGRPRTPPTRVHRWRESHRPPDGRRAPSSLHATRSLSGSLGPTLHRA
jgi:putative transposase